jgi:hypothetical protein
MCCHRKRNAGVRYEMSQNNRLQWITIAPSQNKLERSNSIDTSFAPFPQSLVPDSLSASAVQPCPDRLSLGVEQEREQELGASHELAQM